MKSIPYPEGQKPLITFGINNDGKSDVNNIGFLSDLGNIGGDTSEDFLLRGGLNAPLRAAEDVVRLSRYFFNLKKPNGLLFIAKQNLLSRVSVKTEASRGPLNNGAYTPLKTLAQIGGGFLGAHFEKQGIIRGLRNYEDVIKSQTKEDLEETNRLATLTKLIFSKEEDSKNNFNSIKGYNLNVGNSIIQYGGGPRSILGVGKTKIKFADQRTGIHSPTYKNNFRGGSPHPLAYNFDKIFKGDRGNFTLSTIYSNLTNTLIETLLGVDHSTYNGKSNLQNDSNNVYQSGSFKTNKKSLSNWKNRYQTWDQEDLISQSPNPSGNTKEDFRKILNPTIYPNKKFLSISPDYAGKDAKNIETRVNLGDPGKRGDVSNYMKGKREMNGLNKRGPLDKITFLPLYRSEGVTSDFKAKNDLVKFRIGVIDPTSIGAKTKTYIHFRAFINKFSDSYKATWKGQKYMGRAEEFYKYDGFGRDISIDFTVAAQSKEELIPMYRKLNFLASSLAPSYTDSGYMAGNLSQMTVGGYIWEQPGIIESVNYDIPTESPWEIAIPVESKKNTDFENNQIKELPHIINVSIKFTPIHRFRPAIMETTKDLSDGAELMEDNNAYGNQKYIAIADGDPKIVDDGYADKLNNLGDELGAKYPPPPPPMKLPTIPLSPIP